MGFSCGLVGLPNAGKSTIFNALADGGARVESYPFCTIQANVGTVEVPDPRLVRLADLFPEKKRVPTYLEFIDIAGLVEHASEGEGMGNAFLSDIRAVDAVAHVVRCFEDENVAHVTGFVDPIRDIEIIETELLLKDLETLTKMAKRLHQETKGKDRSAPQRAAAWDRLIAHVAAGATVRTAPHDHMILDLLRDAALLTDKPCLFVANVGEGGENPWASEVRQAAEARGAPSVSIRGKLEGEIGEACTSLEEKTTFLAEYGMTGTGLDELVAAGYRLLDLVTFFTVEGPEVRAWTIRRGTCAPAAGGRIHSDFEDRFVLAEVMDLDELLEAGSERALRDVGKVRRAGHDYQIRDGDVIHFICA